MKTGLIAALVLALAAGAVPLEADAKRLGGGKSSGMQRDMPARTAPDAPPAKPAQPGQAQQATPNSTAAAPGAAATAPRRNWMGPIAGLAAGLGIAALLSHLGFGEGLANLVTMLLLGVVAFFVIRFLLRRFAGGGAAQGPKPALAGAHGGAMGGSPAWQPAQQPLTPAQPMQRSAEQPAARIDTPAAATAAGAAAAAPVTRAFVPAAFDAEAFTRIAKMIFIRLQAANDAADLDDLRRFTTPELFASLRLDIQERGPAAQHTDVTRVEADVLDVADEADRQVVSVRFHGEVVEEKGAAPTPFNEVWHLVRPHDGSREWAIAGIEQLN
jgi:predicted lipid-binding transport protein (Tim44 family)